MLMYICDIYDVYVWLPLGGRWTRCCHYVFMCFLPSFLRSRGGAVTRITESSFRRYAQSARERGPATHARDCTAGGHRTRVVFFEERRELCLAG